MMHSPRVMEWDATWQILMIWTYKDAVKSSYQMGSPKWYLLHKHHFCPETWNNYGGQMDHLNGAKMGGEMFYWYKNDLVIYQNI